MKNILILVFAAIVLSVSSCSDWTTPENLEYRPVAPSEQDPEGYAEALAAVKSYKETAHDIMIVTMAGMSEQPFARPHHLMNMPDSADFICVKNAVGLHPVLVAEIAEVLEKKGTRSVAMVDYTVIDELWTLQEDLRADNGQPESTEDEITAYFKSEASRRIAACDQYGFAGLMVSYEGNTANPKLLAKQKGFLAAVEEWRASHKDAVLMIRGSIRNINYTNQSMPLYKDLLDGADCLVIIAGETAAPGELSRLVTRNLGSAPSGKVIMEVSVPSVDSPEQTGATPQVAAQWVVDQKDNKEFTPLGVCVGNADDDYFRQDMIYRNVRQAISIMNPVADMQ